MNGDNNFSGGCLEERGARIWIFIGFVLGFAAIIAAIWVMVANLNSDGKYLSFSKYFNVQIRFTSVTPVPKASNWPGISLLLQNIFIFIASLVYKFGRSEEMWN